MLVGSGEEMNGTIAHTPASSIGPGYPTSLFFATNSGMERLFGGYVTFSGSFS